MSSHVDDLLNRQMGLRGERGVATERQRRWYYQNWFVFGLVGLLGAVLAWALIEPYFDDMFYWQGEVTKVDANGPLPPRLLEHVANGKTRIPLLQGTITVRDETVLVAADFEQLRPDGSRRVVELADVKVGDTVGLYIDDEHGIDVAYYMIGSPKPQSPSDASLTLEHLRSRTRALGLLMFAIVGGAVGLFIGAADGIVCRLPRRALLSGGVGLLVGLAGGLVSGILANIVWGPLQELAADKLHDGGGAASLGFGILVMGRSLAWALAGMAMGLGQGIALRSGRLLLYGLFGGVIGGLFGGLLFDPIFLLVGGHGQPSAHISRLLGIAVMGAAVGALIGVVELIARDAWLRMTQGPLAGKEFLLFKDLMNVGASPKSDIYLFNDAQVADHHAVMRMTGNECEIEAKSPERPLLVNEQAIKRTRLRHGDRVTIGRTIFVFQRRKG
jgi:hypothetical protein